MKVHRVLIAGALLSLAGFTGVIAQQEKRQPIVIDLDGNGKPERIETRFSGADDSGRYYYLAVLAEDGSTIWNGPKGSTAPDNPLGFGEWHHGVSMPHAAADIDGDGAVELLAPAPQGDVSPATFRILRWKNGEFRPLRSAKLMQQDLKSDVFTWTNSDVAEGRWVSALHMTEKLNVLTADVIDYRGGADAAEGTAMMVPAMNGMKVTKWLKPLPPGKSAKPKTVASPSAGKMLVRYMCQLGAEDMRSSKGEPLTKLQDILAQDRANYHRFNVRHRRDSQDETFFAKAENRQLFEHVPVEATAKAGQWVKTGNAILVVTVYADRVDVRVDGE